jgi:hypothetical protein
MKRLLVGLIVGMLLLAACGTPGAPALPTEVVPTPEPTEAPTEPPVADADTPAVRAAIEALAALLGVPVESITLVSAEAVDWPDSCLGIVRIDALCAQGIVPGYRVVLEAEGETYEYHTDASGAVLAIAESTAQDAAEQAAREALAAALVLDAASFELVAIRLKEFGNACLDVPAPGEMCAEVITPGYVVSLQAEGRQYDYNTDLKGSQARPASLALSWQREGGIAGFCDSLLVYASGEAYASNCKGDQGQAGMLTDDERAELVKWLDSYGAVGHEQSDGAVADSMTIRVSFQGYGSTATLSEAEQGDLQAWAQAVYTRLIGETR